MIQWGKIHTCSTERKESQKALVKRGPPSLCPAISNGVQTGTLLHTWLIYFLTEFCEAKLVHIERSGQRVKAVFTLACGLSWRTKENISYQAAKLQVMHIGICNARLKSCKCKHNKHTNRLQITNIWRACFQNLLHPLWHVTYLHFL